MNLFFNDENNIFSWKLWGGAICYPLSTGSPLLSTRSSTFIWTNDVKDKQFTCWLCKGKINIYSSWQQTGAELNQQLYTRLQKIPYVPKQLNKHNYYVKSIYIILREGSFFY